MTSLSQKIPLRWRMTIVLAGAAALNGGDRAAFSSVLAPMKAELALSDEMVGLLGLIFLWSYAIVAPLGGMIADRISRRRLILFALLAWSAVTLLTGFCFGVTELIVLRCLLGVTESLFLPAAFSLTGDYHEQATRARATTVLSIGHHAGVILGGALAGTIADMWGWRMSFLVLGFLGILWAAPILPVFRAMPTRPPRVKVEGGRGREFWLQTKELVTNGSYMAIILSVMLSGVAVWIFFTWLPLYFHDTYNWKLGAAGFTGFFIMKSPSIFGLGIGGWLSDRVGVKSSERRMLLRSVGYLLCAPFLLYFLLAQPGITFTLTALFLFSLLRSMADANEVPIICDVVPREMRATAIGLMSASITLAGGLGVLAAGLLKGRFGLGAVFASLSVLYVIGSLIMLYAWKYMMPADLARQKARMAATAG